jgi:hypothetical protein
MQSQFFLLRGYAREGAPLPLQPIPKTKNNNKTNNKIKVVYTEDLTHLERQLKLGDELITPLFFRIHVDSLTGLYATGESAESGNAA